MTMVRSFDDRTGTAARSATPDVTRRHVRSAIAVFAFALALAALGWTWASLQPSSAAFADSEEIGGNRLGAGTVDIALGDATVVFEAQLLAPGDVVTGRLELVNAGSLPLTYALSASADATPLSAVLQLVAWSAEDDRCQPVPPAGAGRWRPLEVPVPAALATPTGLETPAIGRLAPGETTLLCMRAQLPLTAPSSVQGQRLAVPLLVTAQHDLATDDTGGER